MGFRSLVVSMAIACFMIGVSPLARAQQPGPAKPAAASPVQTYILGTSDVIEVSVLTHPDYTTRGRINEDGAIKLPYIGSVMAANRTPDQLADEIGKALEKGGYFSRAIVKVDVVSFASRYVTVLGEVGSPGLVPVDRAYRVSEILARVGGVKDSGADYVVLRPQNGPERRLLIKEVATGGDAEDPFVSPGDKIYSPPAELFYVSGQVNAPGAFPLLSDMTIRMALARAGGVTLQGSEKGVRINRHGVRMSNIDLNSKVQPGDVVVVPESLFAF